MTSLQQPLAFFEKIHWNSDGLVAAIAQEVASHEVLMLAWMNIEALTYTIKHREAYYWSRSRQKLWHKGEISGHVQKVHGIYLDCDGDTILLQVAQQGLACHTGRRHCFFQQLQEQPSDRHPKHALEGMVWKTVLPVIKTTEDIYKSRS